MKKFFFVAAIAAFAACNNSGSETKAADSTAAKPVDSSAAKVDSSAAKMDSSAAKMDSAAAKVDSSKTKK